MTKAAGSLDTTPAGIKLWVHEVLRVFFDRLVDDPDRLWLGRLLTDLTEKHFKERLPGLLGLAASCGAAGGTAAASGVADEELLAGLRGLMFGDFMVPGADVKVYRWVGETFAPGATILSVQPQNYEPDKSKCIDPCPPCLLLQIDHDFVVVAACFQGD
jgi:hypothetical protein